MAVYDGYEEEVEGVFLEKDLIGILVKSLQLVGKVNDGVKIDIEDLTVTEVCDLVCYVQELERRLDFVMLGRCPEDMERCGEFEKCRECWEEWFLKKDENFLAEA